MGMVVGRIMLMSALLCVLACFFTHDGLSAIGFLNVGWCFLCWVLETVPGLKNHNTLHMLVSLNAMLYHYWVCSASLEL